MYDVDNTRVEDVMTNGSVGWTMQTTSFAYDIQEDEFQGDRETIIRLLKIREHDALSDMAELNEEYLWGAPTSPTDKRPMGIPFWLQKDADTTPNGAFNGGNPAGFTSGCAGVDSTAYPRWRNWTFGYRGVTSDDLVKKVKKALRFSKFKAPVPHPQLGFGDSNYEIFTTYRVLEQLETLAESRNDNLGNDVARYMNQVVIGGTPVNWVPYLEENDSSDPLYGVNWKCFRPFVKKGWDMKRHKPKQSARQRNVREVHYDCTMNYINYNRRECFVGSLQS